jgi:hypothetical protein
MDIAIAITAALAPALPYRLQGTEEAATEVGKKLGSAVLKSAGDSQTFHASNIGDGAVDQGEGAVAAAKNSIAVGGNVTGNVTIGQNRD